MGFMVEPRLALDSFVIQDLTICQVRLCNNKLFPWLILVPKIDGAREFVDLEEAAQQDIICDINKSAAALKACCDFDKLNIGMLGNVVPQLHIHIVGRRKDDVAWPGPVWGGSRVPYEAGAATLLIQKIQATF